MINVHTAKWGLSFSVDIGRRGVSFPQTVLWQLMTPIWQAWYDIPSVVWWNNLGRILLAVDDLDCRDLLA
jgi:hypothetical protein